MVESKMTQKENKSNTTNTHWFLGTTGRILRMGLAYLIFLLLFKVGFTPTPSMEPTIEVNDLIIYSKHADMERGEIVLFQPPDTNEEYVKRLIAVEGDVISIQGGIVFLNGSQLNEPYVKEAWYGELPETIVPEGHFFVMGDNRNNSADSRDFGFVPNENYIGAATLQVLPFSKFGLK